MNRAGKAVAGAAVALLVLVGAFAWKNGKTEAVKTPEAVSPAVAQNATAAPSPATPRNAGQISSAQLEALQDLSAARKDYAARVEHKLHDWERKDPDAKALKVAGDQTTRLIKAIASEKQLVSRCFVGSVDQEAAKKCGKQLWGVDESGAVQTSP